MSQTSFSFTNKSTGLSTSQQGEQEGEENTVVLSVSDLNKAVRGTLEGQFANFWLKGEISNFTAHGSGHWYFSLKDKKSQVSGVMFKGANVRMKFKPKTGMEVLVRGRISVYEPRGNYQVLCDYMEPAGIGALQQAFEQLKAKLKSEGLFAKEKKKAIPSLPKHIAIVTSPTGAAIRDILNVLKRRYRSAEVTIVPTVVQGEAAAPRIVEALNLAQQLKNVDVIIVGRGGGSMEDLWCFNNEEVARTISACKIPVISAVGHEIDFTISDFVADLRAPTPSAAAELVAKNANELMERLQRDERRLSHMLMAQLREAKIQWQSLNKRLVDPRKRLMDLVQRLDEYSLRLENCIANTLRNRRLTIQSLANQLVNPKTTIEYLKQKVNGLNHQLASAIDHLLKTKKYKFIEATRMLESLSPLQVVARGFSITTKENVVVKSIEQVKAGDAINVRVADGFIAAEVKKTELLK